MLFLILAGKVPEHRSLAWPVHRLTFCCCYFHFRCAAAVPGKYPGGKLCHREANEAPRSRAPQCAAGPQQPTPRHPGSEALPRHKTELRNSVSNFNKVKRYRWKMAPDFPDPIAQSRSPTALIVTYINNSHWASQGWVYSEVIEQQLSKGGTVINLKSIYHLF